MTCSVVGNVSWSVWKLLICDSIEKDINNSILFVRDVVNSFRKVRILKTLMLFFSRNSFWNIENID